MPQARPHSLWQASSTAGRLTDRWLWSANASVALVELANGSGLCAPRESLRGRSVLIRSRDQLPAALALIELDGLARRMVLCPPDLDVKHLPLVMATASVDVVVGDPQRAVDGAEFIAYTPCLVPTNVQRCIEERTEWILLTSGTTGVPKLVVHTFETLTGAMTGGTGLGRDSVWSTFYDMRRYGGLQIFLRAMLGGSSMVLSSDGESVGDFLARVGAHGVTHISGTPSHWRGAVMSQATARMSPRYIRLSGEIADQAILDALRAAYPDVDIAHAFASTEAGVAFDVGDGLSGFPERLIGRCGNVTLRVEDGSLRIKSGRTALCYMGGEPPLMDSEGFVDTGDMIELRDGRYHFVGRRGGVINIGGHKVHPEEIEAVINCHPRVRMSLVKSRKSPVTGAIVVADVVVRPDAAATDALKDEILETCRGALARYKVPAAIRFVPALPVAASGKLVRANA